MKRKKVIVQTFKQYIMITAAAFMYAVAVGLFTDPNRLAPGGITGLAIVLHRFVPLPTGTLYLVLNVPLLLLGVFKFGFKFCLSTVYATLVISGFTNLLAPLGALTEDILLAALAGGVLIGVAVGMILKAGATTGGTDIIVKCLKLKFPYLKTGILFFLIDVIIIMISAIAFGDINPALYAAISVVVTSKMMDIVLYGSDVAKLLYIISDKSDKLTDRILQEVGVGVTHVNGRGAYSGREKNVIMCVVRKNQEPMIEGIVREEDADAFMIITSASEIYGEGYKDYFSDRL